VTVDYVLSWKRAQVGRIVHIWSLGYLERPDVFRGSLGVGSGSYSVRGEHLLKRTIRHSLDEGLVFISGGEYSAWVSPGTAASWGCESCAVGDPDHSFEIGGWTWDARWVVRAT
jgi:hypothetical protein